MMRLVLLLLASGCLFVICVEGSKVGSRRGAQNPQRRSLRAALGAKNNQTEADYKVVNYSHLFAAKPDGTHHVVNKSVFIEDDADKRSKNVQNQRQSNNNKPVYHTKQLKVHNRRHIAQLRLLANEQQPVVVPGNIFRQTKAGGRRPGNKQQNNNNNNNRNQNNNNGGGGGGSMRVNGILLVPVEGQAEAPYYLNQNQNQYQYQNQGQPRGHILDARISVPSANRVILLNCEGETWEVPIGVYACCGKNIYELEVERCSWDGATEPRQPIFYPATRPRRASITIAPRQPLPAPHPSPALKAIAVASATVEPNDPTHTLVCETKMYIVPFNHAKFYACCGEKVYFWVGEECVDGVVIADKRLIHTTQGTPETVTRMVMICGNTEHWITAAEHRHHGCCGSLLFDLRSEVCSRSDDESERQQAKPRPKTTTTSSPQKPVQTGEAAAEDLSAGFISINSGSFALSPFGSNDGDSNCPTGFICCPSFSPVIDLAGELRCCDESGPYDPKLSHCSPQRN